MFDLPPARRGKAHVSGDGAELTDPGGAMPHWPAMQQVQPGMHTITLRVDGYAPQRQQVHVTEARVATP